MKFLTIVLFLALAACSSSPPKKTNEPRILRLLDIQNPDDPALAECAQRCQSEDAELARTLQETLRLQKAQERGQNPSLAEISANIAKMSAASETWFKKYKDSKDPDEALGAYQLLIMVRRGNARDLSDIKPGVEKLHERFPREPRAHYLYGELLASRAAAPLEVIRAYKRCLDLDPKDATCVRAYTEAATRYVAKDCPGSALDKTLGFYLSGPEGERYTRKLDGGERGAVFVEDLARLDRKDVSSVWVNPADPARGLQFDQVQLQMTSQGREKLATLTREHLHQMLAVAVKGRAILNAVIMTPITEGSVIITLGMAPEAEKGAQSVFGSLCRKPRHRKLPADLQWKAPAAPGV